ncbi:MAG TPA: phosphoglycerate dehydrogenase [Pseudomonadales bacterium]|nr:phosphoglycerate dehydrogenase [Pseudomonadales bacterium]
MYKIQTFNKISVKGLNQFDRADYEVASEMSNPDAILLRSHKLAAADVGASVRGIARAGAGTNNIPVKEMTERGIVVFNTPGANANAVKELVLAAMLLASRDIIGGVRFVRDEQQETDDSALSKLLEAEKKRFAGHELAGKTLGVVGLGAIGALVANMALDLGMDVLGYDPAISVDAAWRLSHRVQRVENLHSLVSRVDFISLHLPVLDSTRNLVNADLLKAMQPGTCLLNFAREEIVDNNAVIHALEQKQLSKYITDFPTLALLKNPDVIPMPHIGASTEEAEENCAVMAANQLKDFLLNGNIRNSVNFPTVSLERTGGFRIAVANRNVPKMLGQILSVLADGDNNVIDMINKSRDDVAYNLIDVAAKPADDVLEKIRAINGIINVRLV